MQKLPSMLASILVLSGALGIGAMAPAHAQTASVGLTCDVNICQASAVSPGSPTPFVYNWSYTGVMHLSSPFRCDSTGPMGHKATCMFQCYQGYQDRVMMNVTVVDAAGALIGTASSGAVCNGTTGGV